MGVLSTKVVVAIIAIVIGVMNTVAPHTLDTLLYNAFRISLAGPIQPCLHPYSADPRSEPTCFFKSNYYDAREAFRREVASIGVEVRSLSVLQDEQNDLTIDVAVLPGSNESVVMHVSGTHGTEGYVGSAIQTAWIRENVGYAKWKSKPQSERPTMILVHALNPYGMANWRRGNEDNIDINRNAIFTPTGWTDSKRFGRTKDGQPWNKEESRLWDAAVDGPIPVLDRLPNEFSYETIGAYLYSDGRTLFKPNLWNKLMLIPTVLRIILTGQSPATKIAVVSGTYQHPQGLFYGGKSMTKSHALLSEFLHSTHGHLFSSATKVVVLDVHSGLGPIGRDTLAYWARFADANAKATLKQKVNKRFNAVEKEGRELPYKVVTQLDGYENLDGDVPHGYIPMFKVCSEKPENCFGIIQEFGTVPGPLVLVALIEENLMYHSGNEQERLEYAREIFHTFTPQKQSFFNAVIDRGLTVLDQCSTI